MRSREKCSRRFFDSVRVIVENAAASHAGSVAAIPSPTPEAIDLFQRAYVAAVEQGLSVDGPHVAQALLESEKLRAILQACGADPDVATKTIAKLVDGLGHRGLAALMPLCFWRYLARETWSIAAMSMFVQASWRVALRGGEQFTSIDVFQSLWDPGQASGPLLETAGLRRAWLLAYLSHGVTEYPAYSPEQDPGAGPYQIRIYNDDFTTMDFVAAVLKMEFHHPDPEQAMLSVHRARSAAFGRYSWPEAVAIVAKVRAAAELHGWPLKLEIEPAS